MIEILSFRSDQMNWCQQVALRLDQDYVIVRTCHYIYRSVEHADTCNFRIKETDSHMMVEVH